MFAGIRSSLANGAVRLKRSWSSSFKIGLGATPDDAGNLVFGSLLLLLLLVARMAEAENLAFIGRGSMIRSSRPRPSKVMISMMATLRILQV